VVKFDITEIKGGRHIMTFNAAKDLPVLILVGGFVLLIIYGAIYTRKEERKENKDREQNRNKEK